MNNLSNEDVYTNLPALLKLRHSARGFNFLPRQSLRSILSGRQRSRLRGRGLDFDELRHYHPGDDIRSMDWRATRRTGKPQVRVYTEERDRPVMVVVDQRLSMFFGSQQKMKSVVAAEVAAITAWRVLAAGDRIGSILFNDERILEAKPTRNERRVIAWLGDLVAMNKDLRVTAKAGGNPAALAQALAQLERSIGHDTLVVLVSDFSGWNEAALAAIGRISRHNDIVCSLVFDPLERDISNASGLVVSDGRYQFELDTAQQDLAVKFEANGQRLLARLQGQLNRHNIALLEVNSATPVAEQMRQLLGGQRVPS